VPAAQSTTSGSSIGTRVDASSLGGCNLEGVVEGVVNSKRERTSQLLCSRVDVRALLLKAYHPKVQAHRHAAARRTPRFSFPLLFARRQQAGLLQRERTRGILMAEIVLVFKAFSIAKAGKDIIEFIAEQLKAVSCERMSTAKKSFEGLKTNIQAGKVDGGSVDQFVELTETLQKIESLLARYHNGIRHNRRHNEWQASQLLRDQQSGWWFWLAVLVNPNLTDCMLRGLEPWLSQ
jgi:hypothetical protein